MARDQFIIIVIMMMMIKTPTDLCKIKNACDLCGLNIMIYTLFISLHILSMWETICDAWACWSVWNFGPNSIV